jgi:hypothetical protein
MVNDWHLNILNSELHNQLRRSDIGVADQNHFMREFQSNLDIPAIVQSTLEQLSAEEKTFLEDWYNTSVGRTFFGFSIMNADTPHPDVFTAMPRERQDILRRLTTAMRKAWCSLDTFHRMLIQSEQLVRFEPRTTKETLQALKEKHREYLAIIQENSAKNLDRIAFRTKGYANDELSAFVRFLESKSRGRVECIFSIELWTVYEKAFTGALAKVFPEKDFPRLTPKSSTQDFGQ